jgi:predicted enzyme related to lactoylglutathione lyase
MAHEGEMQDEWRKGMCGQIVVDFGERLYAFRVARVRTKFAATERWSTAMGNPFVHIELATTDINKAKSFYGSLFDWQLEDHDMGNNMIYTMVKVGNGVGGGMMKHPMPGAPSAWVPYVDVANVNAATAKAKSLGAKVLRDVGEVPNVGSFSIIQDPTGGVIGLWQEKARK